MKRKDFSWISLAAVVIAVITFAFAVVGVPKNVLVWGQFPLLLLMMIASSRTFSILKLEGLIEGKVWLWLLFASVFTLAGDVLFATGNLMNPVSIPIITVSSGLMFCAYGCFIIGLIMMGRYVRSADKKSGLLIPVLVVVSFITVAVFFMIRSFIGSELDDILKITFLVYILADAFLILSNIIVVMRTMGGTLGKPYLILAFGCLSLVAYQMTSLFILSASGDIFNSWIQALFVTALTVLAIGADARYQLQKNLSLNVK